MGAPLLWILVKKAVESLQNPRKQTKHVRLPVQARDGRYCRELPPARER